MKKRKNALYFRCRKVNWITVKYRHMNRINKWIWVAAMAGISIACQKENVGLYNRGDSMVYFQVQNFSGSNGAEDIPRGLIFRLSIMRQLIPQ